MFFHFYGKRKREKLKQTFLDTCLAGIKTILKYMDTKTTFIFLVVFLSDRFLFSTTCCSVIRKIEGRIRVKKTLTNS